MYNYYTGLHSAKKALQKGLNLEEARTFNYQV